MAAFLRVRHFTRRVIQLDYPFTADLAGREGLPPNVQLPIDSVHLAGFRMPSLEFLPEGLSHFSDDTGSDFCI